MLSEPLPKSSIEDWVKRVEAKLNFRVTPREHPVIAVDESVVKCGGRPVYVW